MLRVCDSNVYLNVKLDPLVSNRTLTYTVYINEKKCYLKVTNTLGSNCSGLFRIYNEENVAKGESIIHQISGVKFYHYSRGNIYIIHLFLKHF